MDFPPAKPAPKPSSRGTIREGSETVVFVVALVLMLKLFVVEAFVIPTGSMAETLYGYQKIVDCPECGFRFPVNASNEAEPADNQPVVVVGGCCPNCRHRFRFEPPPRGPKVRTGDRVLVHKALYHLQPPERGDVVVFKFPVDPQVRQTAQNYIKRLWGLGGETIGVSRGDLYRTTALTYPATAAGPDGQSLYPRPDDPGRLWERGPSLKPPVTKTVPPYEPAGPDYTYHNAAEAVALFDKSRTRGFVDAATEFGLIRKPDPQVMAMRRIVYDNDHQSKTAARLGLPPRWAAEAAANGWAADAADAPRVFTHTGGQFGWVRYQHRADDPASLEVAAAVQAGLKADAFPPGPVTNYLGYNSSVDAAVTAAGQLRVGGAARETTEFWVGDLMLECSATFDTADAELVLELSKGPHRYQAQFAGGTVRLVRTGPQGKEMATRPTPITAAGTYALRFANVDCRLRVWVDDTPIDFGPDADYPPDAVPTAFDPADRWHEGWVRENDIAAPAGVGAKGGAAVRNLKLWRDSYFTPTGADGRPAVGDNVAADADTFYVHPGHYLCLGDNSAQSSDGRTWGTVPERLMLGKAVFVFWPGPVSTPTLWPWTWSLRGADNRVGIIQ